LRGIVQKWLGAGSPNMNNSPLVKELTEFPINFLKRCSSGEGSDSNLFDDEDTLAWEFEAQRWARMLFLGVLEEQRLENIFVVFAYLFQFIFQFRVMLALVVNSANGVLNLGW
jgi:hypothetical protein